MDGTFDVELWQDEEGWWVVECPAIPGCVSQGATEDEALTSIQDALRLCLESRGAMGLQMVIKRHREGRHLASLEMHRRFRAELHFIGIEYQ